MSGRRVIARGLGLLVLAITGCGSGAGPSDGGADAGAPDLGLRDAGPADADFLTEVEAEAELWSLADRQGFVKYLARVDGRGPAPPIDAPCYFQNTGRYADHLAFLRSFAATATVSAADYLARVLRPATRVWWGGGLSELREANPLTGAPAAIGYVVYSESVVASTLLVPDIVEVDRRLKSCAPFAARRLAFLPADVHQERLARARRAELGDAGVAVLSAP